MSLHHRGARAAPTDGKGRRYRNGVPFECSVEHPFESLEFRLDDDDTPETRAVLSHRLDRFVEACVAAGGIPAPDHVDGRACFALPGKYVRATQTAILEKIGK